MSPLRKLCVGVIGCGNISGAYLKHAKFYQHMVIATVADLNEDLAKAKAKEFNLEEQSVAELLKNPRIDIILNLTTPQAHVAVNIQALENGKHVYCEKPFGLKLDETQKVLDLAKAKNLRVGCAPDTFMGASHQTARQLLDGGWIGPVISGTAIMMCAGHESWHPNPSFYYKTGGGPLMDMGPYYITNLVQMLGPVVEVQAMSCRSGERTCSSELQRGVKISVDVDTHLTGNLRFENGALISLIMSFDAVAAQHSPIELHGPQGSLLVPDPNGFGGQVMFAQRNVHKFEAVPHTFPYAENMRSIGVADMAGAIIENREHRANGELAHHVLDVMLSFQQSAKIGQNVVIQSRCKRPMPMNRFAVIGEV